MEFRTKYDSKYLIFISIVIAILAAVVIVLTVLMQQSELGKTERLGLIIVNGFLGLLILWSIWSHLSIRIRLTEDKLEVGSAIFKFRVAYTDMVTIRTTKDFYTGKRMMTSSEGIAITSKKAAFELKISPQNQDLFLKELLERAPQIRQVR